MTNPFATTTLLGLLLFGMITVAAWAPQDTVVVATRHRPGAPCMTGDAHWRLALRRRRRIALAPIDCATDDTARSGSKV